MPPKTKPKPTPPELVADPEIQHVLYTALAAASDEQKRDFHDYAGGTDLENDVTR